MSASDSGRAGAVAILCLPLAALSVVAALAGIVAGGGGGRRAVAPVRGAAVRLYGEGLYEFCLVAVGLLAALFRSFDAHESTDTTRTVAPAER